MLAKRLAIHISITILLPYIVAALHPHLTLNPRTSSISVNTNSSTTVNDNNIPLIHCSGDEYRTGLSPISCRDALNQIPKDDRQIRKFGHAVTSGRDGGVRLPYRFISFDGLCTLDIVLQDHASESLTSYAKLHDAAASLVRQCAVLKGEGGIAMNIGYLGSTGLILTSYVPRVLCYPVTLPPPHKSCTELAQMMPTSLTPRTFGEDGDPQASVKLPLWLHESTHRCVASIKTTGITDASTFYEMWEAVVAVNGICVKYGRMGTAFLRGQRQQLFVEVGADWHGRDVNSH